MGQTPSHEKEKPQLTEGAAAAGSIRQKQREVVDFAIRGLETDSFGLLSELMGAGD